MFACFSNECKQTLSKFAIKGAFISRYIMSRCSHVSDLGKCSRGRVRKALMSLTL